MTNDVTYIGCIYDSVSITGLSGDHEPRYRGAIAILLYVHTFD